MFFALLASSLLACKREPPPPTPAPTAPVPPHAPSTAAPVDTRQNNAAPSNRVPSIPPASVPSDRTDLDLTNDVRRAIAGDTTLSPAAKQVLVNTTNGIVQLSGTLPSETDRENLRIAVNRVPGVKSIDNRTTVRK